MKKKGVELSMNLIIIAAIGLLILVILAVLVVNAGGGAQKGVQGSCNLKGGVCGTCTSDRVIPDPAPGQELCTAAGQSCCKVLVATG